jgi:Zonular occludens toxin (Zot)
MAVYFITGTLGCGKTLCTVGKIRDYLGQGRRVATNLDINMTALCKSDSKVSITRVPDKPVLRDLECLGIGCDESDESKYGLLVLDELGTWFNSRNWRDKDRLDVIDWFLHARKKHWDIYFIVQSIDSLDGQLVSALCEHLVICKRTDRLSLPFIGPILKMCGIEKVLPKIHVAKVYYGQTTSSMAVDRWWYRGRDLYSAYNTDQIFDDESCSVNTVLPAYYQNNIQLISEYNGKIKALTGDLKTARPTGGLSFKTLAVALFFVSMIGLSVRTYAKYQEITGSSAQVQQIGQNPVKADKTAVASVQAVNVHIPDVVEQMVTGATIIVSSYYIADGRINAVLHLVKNEQETVLTLDDLRAFGYASTIRGKVITCAKVGFIFNFTVS